MTEKRTPINLVGRFADHLARLGGNRMAGLQVKGASPEAPDVVTESSDAASQPEPSPRLPPEDKNGGPAGSLELDLVQLQKEGFLTPHNQRSLIAEEFRIIKRPLLRDAFDQRAEQGDSGHVVMVTSARPGEGKTFTSINLAMSVATERDLFVLLVDCDIRRMGLSKKLGVEGRKGIMDLLMNPGLPISEVIMRTNIPNLSVISSGQPVEAATELFASQSMTKLVHDIGGRYRDRFIIFDAPPVLASSEPGVLASHVGQVVMVVRANETSSRAVAECMPLISTCPKVHFLLNGATTGGGPDRFGHYGTY